MNDISIFSGRATQYLAQKVVDELSLELGKCDCPQFADGEFQPDIKENVRGKDVFIIQSTFPSSDNLMELLMMIDASKRASANKITAIIPYFGFARADKKDTPRCTITSKLIADMLQTAGCNHVITIDLHADQIQGFFNIPEDNLHASSIFLDMIKDNKNIMFASPDIGGSKRASKYAKQLGTTFATCYKHRSKPNVVDEMLLLGDVKDKDVILVDDIIDTGGTLCKAAQLIKDSGAKSVKAFIVHPVLSGNAIERIEQSSLDELIVTDTIPLKRESKKIKVISCAKILAESIKRTETHGSISSL